MKKAAWFLVISAFISLAWGFSAFAVDAPEPSKLNWGLCSKIAAANPQTNMVCSPASAKGVLHLLYLGAAGETKKELANFLGIQEKSEQEALSKVKDELSSLKKVGHKPRRRADNFIQEIKNKIDEWNNTPNGEEVLVVNNIFVDKRFKLDGEFLSKSKQYLYADVQNVDFSSPDAKRTLNDWVSRRTKGKIQNFVENTSGVTSLIAVNAIYFDGAWQTPFEKKLTKQEPFHSVTGNVSNVAMMHQRSVFRCTETKDFQLVVLPYFDPRFHLTVILPAKTSSVAKIESLMEKPDWEHQLSSLSSRVVELSLPRFKMQNSLDLISPLEKLGVNAAFNPEKADFGPTISGKAGLFVGKFLQKVYMDVNEEGTVAAVVSMAEMMEGAASTPSEKMKMVVDRPFIVILRDNEAENPLFVGHVMNIQK